MKCHMFLRTYSNVLCSFRHTSSYSNVTMKLSAKHYHMDFPSWPCWSGYCAFWDDWHSLATHSGRPDPNDEWDRVWIAVQRFSMPWWAHSWSAGFPCSSQLPPNAPSAGEIQDRHEVNMLMQQLNVCDIWSPNLVQSGDLVLFSKFGLTGSPWLESVVTWIFFSSTADYPVAWVSAHAYDWPHSSGIGALPWFSYNRSEEIPERSLESRSSEPYFRYRQMDLSPAVSANCSSRFDLLQEPNRIEISRTDGRPKEYPGWSCTLTYSRFHSLFPNLLLCHG